MRVGPAAIARRRVSPPLPYSLQRAQTSPFLAAAMQQGCLQALPASSALAQHDPALYVSARL